jgi:hypothetical protein
VLVVFDGQSKPWLIAGRCITQADVVVCRKHGATIVGYCSNDSQQQYWGFEGESAFQRLSRGSDFMVVKQLADHGCGSCKSALATACGFSLVNGVAFIFYGYFVCSV